MPSDMTYKEWVKNQNNINDENKFEDITIDVTSIWKENKLNGNYEECKEILINNKKFNVGDNGVSLNLNNRKTEIEIAKALSNNYGYNVKLLPEISGKNKYIRIPDIMIDDKPFEIKTINGKGKNTIKHAIKNSKGQSNDIILNIVNNDLIIEDVIKRVENLFRDDQCDFMKSCIVIREGKIIKSIEKKEIGTRNLLKQEVIPIDKYTNIKYIKSQESSDNLFTKIDNIIIENENKHLIKLSKNEINDITNKYKGNEKIINEAFNGKEFDFITTKILKSIKSFSENVIIKKARSSDFIPDFEPTINLKNNKISSFLHEFIHSLDYMKAYISRFKNNGSSFKWISDNLTEIREKTLKKINNTIPEKLIMILKKQNERLISEVKKEVSNNKEIYRKEMQKEIDKYGTHWNKMPNSLKISILQEKEKKLQKQLINKIADNDAEIRKWCALSDLYDAITNGCAINKKELIAGHTSSYYNDNTLSITSKKHGIVIKQNTEMLADYGEMRLGGYEEQLNWLKENDEELYNKLEETYRMLGD